MTRVSRPYSVRRSSPTRESRNSYSRSADQIIDSTRTISSNPMIPTKMRAMRPSEGNLPAATVRTVSRTSPGANQPLESRSQTPGISPASHSTPNAGRDENGATVVEQTVEEQFPKRQMQQRP